MNFMAYLVDTMKQDSGQNQFSRGEAGLGVTAASAIQALQEAGGKITRLHTAGYMESFRQAVEQMIYVLSDRITEERVIMVAGQDSAGTLRPRHVKLLPARPSLPEAGMNGGAMGAMGAGQDEAMGAPGGAEAGMPGQAMPTMGAGQDEALAALAGLNGGGAMGAGQDGAMGALAGLNGGGAEADIAAALQRALGGAEAGMAAMGTGRAIERPPYNVRVQIQRRSPLQIQANNEFVLQVAQICGQAGQPLPPLAVVSLLQGIDNKQEVLSALREADQTRTQMQQLQGAVEQLQAQLQKANDTAEALKIAVAAQKPGTSGPGAPEEMAAQAGALPQEAAGMQPTPEAAPQEDMAGPEQEADAKMQALAQMLGSMQAGQA